MNTEELNEMMKYIKSLNENKTEEEVDGFISEIKEGLISFVNDSMKMLKEMANEVEKTREENERLKEALRFYTEKNMKASRELAKKENEK